MATIIKVDGSSVEIVELGLGALQKAVGGYIEFVGFPDGSALVCNEEGKVRELPPNPAATAILRRLSRGTGDWIAGDAIFLTAAENSSIG
jgi:hypothetical protein